MNVRLQTFVASVRERWNGFERDQKIKIAGASALILIAFIAILYIMLRPNYVALVSNSDLVTNNAIKEQLTTAGIKSKDADEGRTILIDEKDKVTAEVILLQQTNYAKSEQFTFTDALDLMSLGTTESVKAETLVRAKAGEIARDLEAFDGVEVATVEIGNPKDNQFFIENADDVTASVQLTLNKEITDVQAESIAKFVASSVVGLDVKNVVVIDNKANMLYSGDMVQDQSRQLDIEAQKTSAIEERVKKQLQPLYNEVIVTPSISFDWDKSVIDELTYAAPNADTPNVGIISDQKNSQSTLEGGTNGEAPGTATNGGTTIYGQSGSTQSASEKTNDINYKLNEKRVQTEKNAGDINKDDSSLSVMVYNYAYYNQDYMEKNDLLNGLTWEEFKSQTVPVPITIDQEVINSVITATGIENITVIGYQVPTFIDTVVTPPRVQEIVMFVVLGLLILLLAILIFRNTHVEEVEEVEPELSVEDLLVSTKVEEISEVQEAEAIKIKQENAMKTQIDKFVTERPDTAAQLLRNWLNEDWE